MDTEQKDYTGWSDDYMSTVPLTFVEEADPRAQRHDALQVHLGERPKPIVAEMVAGRWASRRAAQGAARLPARPGRPERRGRRACCRSWSSSFPTPVPLGYYYDYEGTYWVDPATGIIVDTEKRETRTVGLAQR